MGRRGLPSSPAGLIGRYARIDFASTGIEERATPCETSPVNSRTGREAGVRREACRSGRA